MESGAPAGYFAFGGASRRSTDSNSAPPGSPRHLFLLDEVLRRSEKPLLSASSGMLSDNPYAIGHPPSMTWISSETLPFSRFGRNTNHFDRALFGIGDIAERHRLPRGYDRGSGKQVRAIPMQFPHRIRRGQSFFAAFTTNEGASDHYIPFRASQQVFRRRWMFPSRTIALP